MELVNLKMSESERDRNAPTAAGGSDREYPYGLSLNLENESLEKLGISTLPKVGETMTIIAKVKVTSVSMHEGENRTKAKSVTLQITDAAVKRDAPPDAAEVIYKAA